MKTSIGARIIALALLAALDVQLSTVLAQSTMFTYQGRVVDNGTNFNGAGLLKFALVTSTNTSSQATATAHLTGSFVTSCTVVLGGSGYVAPPALSFSGGGGSGATATATVSTGAVTSIAINNAGSGYTNAPTVTIAPPPDDITYVTYWSNDGTSVAGSEPAAAVSVSVANGLFTVVLGDTTAVNMMAIDASLFTQPNLQLRVWFDDGAHGSAPLSPVQNLTPTPYAIAAQYLASVVDNNTIIPGEYETIGGGSGNTDSNYFATVGGGQQNSALGFDAAIGGGGYNTASGNTATVGGGFADRSTGDYSTVGGGNNNTSSNSYATVAGGYDNTAGGLGATVGGGYDNKITGSYTTIGGGYLNNASGNYAMIPGGYNNTVAGSFSFAAGYQAQALQYGSFVWNDESGGSFSSSTPNSFSVRAAGGLLFAGDVSISGGASAYHRLSLSGGNSTGYLYGSYPGLGDGIHLGYNCYYDASGIPRVVNPGGGTSRISADYGEIILAVGGTGLPPATTYLDVTQFGVTVYGTFVNNSDRNAKQNFQAVDPARILEKVVQLPVSEWRYKTDPATPHLGPMAQDFHALFELGRDEKGIAPIDEGGVALAAIQGLNQKLNEKDAVIEGLKQRLEKLEQLIAEKNEGAK